jgi:hypothetical protein
MRIKRVGISEVMKVKPSVSVATEHLAIQNCGSWPVVWSSNGLLEGKIASDLESTAKTQSVLS